MKGEACYTVRPGSLLPDADFDAERREIETRLARAVSDSEFASYLMYPKVFTEFALTAETYGPVSTLPTPAYFYGLSVGEEVLPEIETGKVLIIQHVATTEPDEQAMVKVFFELNGQSRMVKVPDRSRVASRPVRRKAEAGHPGQVGAPMPGIVSTIAVSTGQAIRAGDVLLSIEAMKMETALHADRDGTVSEVLSRQATRSTARISS